MFKPSILILLSAALIPPLAGCSISRSVGSVSDSVSSISESSSPKDGIGKEKVPYRDDIANLTYSVRGSSMTAAEFPIALTRAAKQSKITDWASEKATYYGIAKGLKKAGVPKERVQDEPFLQDVLRSNQDALKLIQDGYRY